MPSGWKTEQRVQLKMIFILDRDVKLTAMENLKLNTSYALVRISEATK